MATVLENLTTAQANIAAEIAAISANLARGYAIDGQTVQDTTDYLLRLQESLRNIETAISNASGPFESIEEAFT